MKPSLTESMLDFANDMKLKEARDMQIVMRGVKGLTLDSGRTCWLNQGHAGVVSNSLYIFRDAPKAHAVLFLLLFGTTICDLQNV